MRRVGDSLWSIVLVVANFPDVTVADTNRAQVAQVGGSVARVITDDAAVGLFLSSRLAGVQAIAGLVADYAVAAKGPYETATPVLVARAVTNATDAADIQVRWGVCKWEVLSSVEAGTHPIAGVVANHADATELARELTSLFGVTGTVADVAAAQDTETALETHVADTGIRAGLETVVAGIAADTAAAAIASSAKAGEQASITGSVADDTTALVPSLFADLVAVAGTVADNNTTANVCSIDAGRIPVTGVVADADAVP
jgi:uncharacterized protein YyaL (SSP411 family)